MALFAVLVLPALLPLLVQPLSRQDPQLPPCCRRDGKHHCAMMAMMERTSPETSFRQEPPACPYRSGSLTPAQSFNLLPGTSSSFYAGVIEHPTIHQQRLLTRLVSEARSHHKRGPPLLAL